MKKVFIFFILLFCLNLFSGVGKDDRIYIRGSLWDDLFSGIARVYYDNQICTGFLIDNNIVLTISHCLNKNLKLDPGEVQKKSAMIRFNYQGKTKTYRSSVFYLGLFPSSVLKINEKIQAYNFNDSLWFPYQDKKARPWKKQESQDYAFIYLKEKIPSFIKRFKIFDSSMLEDYEILGKKEGKASYPVSKVAYFKDNDKTKNQRMAHIGCYIRESAYLTNKQEFFYSDCDQYNGGSGSPIFYILRHKKTRKIELAALAISASGSANKNFNRFYDPKKNKFFKIRTTEYISYFFYIGSYDKSIRLNGKVLENLKKFKKNPHLFVKENMKIYYKKTPVKTKSHPSDFTEKYLNNLRGRSFFKPKKTNVFLNIGKKEEEDSTETLRKKQTDLWNFYFNETDLIF